MVRRILFTAITLLLLTGIAGAQTSRQLAVFGSATVVEPAEVLRITMTIIAQGPTADQAYERAITRSDQVVEAFRQFGFGPKDYDTRYVVERRPHPSEKRKLVFLAAVGLSLVVDDFSAGTQMLDVATKLGVREFVTYFDITDRRSAYEKALRRALADARIKAEAIASEAGIKLGSLVAFEELTGAPDDYEYPQPLVPADYEGYEQGQTPPAGTGSVRMAPQPYRIMAEVRAAFEILE